MPYLIFGLLEIVVAATTETHSSTSRTHIAA
jgi:hypothetical protein